MSLPSAQGHYILNKGSSRHNQRRSQIPRELPELNIEERPPTQGVIDIKLKKLSGFADAKS